MSGIAALHINHVELYETTRNGVPTFRLICPDHTMVEFFDEWAYKLAKAMAFKSTRTYCYAVKDLLNYVHQVSVQSGGLTALQLMDALDSYESYLVSGVYSSSSTARDAARVLGSKGLGGASVAVHFAGVNRFITASEAMREALLQMQEAGYISELAISMMPLTTTKYRDAPKKVSAAIKANSWLAGCIAGGVKKIRKKHLAPVSKPSSLAHTDEFGGDNKTFPIDKCGHLIQSADCLRDKVLWSLLAASGCRISEALTIMWDDIHIDIENPRNNKVFIIDPETRLNVLIRYIPEEKLNKLDHKGRVNPGTFLIEPFASMFWKYLGLYHDEQRAIEKATCRPVAHRFLIRNLRDGGPMPTSYQAVYERFNAAALKVTGVSYGFHSLRHMYGYYLVNHCPNPSGRDKFGLELKTVQYLMGHKSIKATERYARKDARMLEVTFSAINMLRMSTPNFSVVKVQIQHLENELKNLRASLNSDYKND
jgi:integrase/recombinase XerD